MNIGVYLHVRNFEGTLEAIQQNVLKNYLKCKNEKGCGEN